MHRCASCGSKDIHPIDALSVEAHYKCNTCNMYYKRSVIDVDDMFIYHEMIMKPQGMWHCGGNPVTIRITHRETGIFSEMSDKSSYKARRAAEDNIMHMMNMRGVL